MSLQDIVQGFKKSSQGYAGHVPDSWLQGRTVYGGMTAALCFMAADDLAEGRPLRSAFIAFVGPSNGELSVAAEVIRAGRTASTVRAQLSSEKGPGVEALFTYSGNRDSKVHQPVSTVPHRPPAVTDQSVPPKGVPGFTQHLEYHWASESLPFAGGSASSLRAWVRLRDPVSRAHPLSLLCIADALPPAVVATLTDFAPLSSMTWMIDFYDDTPTTEDGWWLLDATADFATGGHSSQDMTIWNSRGECVAKGRQMITLFA